MKKPILVCNIGWMEKYRGLTGDKIIGGGAFVEKKGYGHEIYNFAAVKGRMYGFVQVRGQLDITRLGARPDYEKATGILVVWCAVHPIGRGTFVIGWYKKATVYTDYQESPIGADRVLPDTTEEAGYYIAADQKNATILECDRRTLRVPRGKGGMGQANVWYADSGSSIAQQFRSELDVLIATGTPPMARPKTLMAKGAGWQLDIEKRLACERAAVKAVGEWYEAKGFIVRSVEKENIGWDLEADLPGAQLLRIEVKGASGPIVGAELTPNEYAAVKTYRDSYRLCLVSHALTARKLKISHFRYSGDYWTDQDNRRLDFEDVVAARVKIASVDRT